MNGDGVAIRKSEDGFTAIERRIADEIVRPLLGTVPEHADDSLIDLGATSLKLLQMFVRIEETFNVELSLDDPLDQATIASLAISVVGK